jgi:dynein heavy chain, axonemal
MHCCATKQINKQTITTQTGLYAAEDLEAIATACRVDCQRRRIPPTKLNLFAQYLNRVRANVHVVLCMSPIGEAFRDRLRMFPGENF